VLSTAGQCVSTAVGAGVLEEVVEDIVKVALLVGSIDAVVAFRLSEPVLVVLLRYPLAFQTPYCKLRKRSKRS
jgi:hypothetical protein